MLEKRSRGSLMRDLVMTVGGPLLPGEGMKGYLRRVAKLAGITARQAKSAWYTEYRYPEDTVAYWKLRAAINKQQIEEGKARDELAELRRRIALLEDRLLAPEADAHR